MIIDSLAIRSLADLYRQEQAAGRCLDPDQAAAAAVTHLQAIGYRRSPHRDPDAAKIVTPRPDPDHLRSRTGHPDDQEHRGGPMNGAARGFQARDFHARGVQARDFQARGVETRGSGADPEDPRKGRPDATGTSLTRP